MEHDPEYDRSEESRLLLNALADGELDAAAALSLEARLASDAALQSEYERIVEARSAVRRLGKPDVDDAFRHRIAALAVPRASRSDARPASRRAASGGWRNLVAAALVGAVLSGGGTYLLTAPTPGDALEAAVTDSHMRGLLAASPVDVASSDRHTVKPWLDARIGVSPPASDFAADGFELIGGRVDVINGRSAPSLVYRHREHQISLIALPVGAETPDAEVASLDVRGYHVVKWTGKGFSYWAVSDLEPAELVAFVKLYRAQS